jgi:hypothetical protein
MTEKMPLTTPETSPGSERFESDTQKVVRKHLEDKEHVITDDEIRNVRVGMTPPAGSERHLEEIIDKEIKTDAEETTEEKPADDPIIPWDTVEH